ncbi:MAG: urate hydroxylase PuuD [Verrucomicrobiota bacterium]
MNADLNQSLDAVIRWIHVFAGIMWVGTTYFFTWLDGRFTELEKSANEKGEPVWMVHSGGFYRVEKQKAPQPLPLNLHWFRWEAALTWMSGMTLFIVVYYMGGLLLNAEESRLSNHAAIALSVGLLIGGWLFYDLILGRLFKNEFVGATLSFIVIAGTSWFLARYFAGRAAFLQLGAMFGTIMVANVWMRILPAQKRMVAALKEGKTPDASEAKRAKNASKQNTFMAVPTVFIMISNHFPIAYGNSRNWIVLSAIVLVGWFSAKLIRRA